MSGYIGKRERKRRQETDTRHLIGVQALTEYGLVTYGQETLVYFLIKPANLSVLSEASIGRRIYALMTVLKGVAEVEMLCLNSRESFEENKLFLRRRMEEEQNPVVRSLLEKDQKHLDRIQVQMATAREFLIIVRLKEEEEREALAYLSRIEKSLKEQGFSVSSAGREDIKRLLAVYYEQNVTTEKFEDLTESVGSFRRIKRAGTYITGKNRIPDAGRQTGFFQSWRQKVEKTSERF